MQKSAIAVLAPVLLAVACGGAPGDADEVLTAEPYPREAEASEFHGEPEEGEAVPDDEAQSAQQQPPPDDAQDDAADPEEASGPRPADAAAYVRAHLPDDALDHDVLLVDDPPEEPRLLLAVVTADHQAAVEAAGWDGEAFHRDVRVDAGPAESLGTLRTPHMGAQRLVALGLRHDGELRVGVWRLTEEELTAPDDCPVDGPRGLRGQGTDLEIGCQAPEAGEDRDERTLVWREGAFRPPEAASRSSARPQRPEPSERSGRPDRPGGPPDHAEASPSAGQGAAEASNGRSDAADDPPGTQGGGPGGR